MTSPAAPPPADPGAPGTLGPRLEVSRHLPPADVDRVLALVAAAGEADGVGPLSEHVLLHLRLGGEEPGRHLLLVDDAAPGQPVVGYAHLDPTDQVAGPSAELVVAPDRRRGGLGTALVQAVERESPARVRLWAHGTRPDARRLAASLGYVVARELWQMRRSLGDDLPPVQLPEGVSVRTFDPDDPRDADGLLAVNAAAFADHPEQGSWTRADLAARVTESWFDPRGLFLAAGSQPPDSAAHGSDGDPAAVPELLGFHWTKIHGDDPAPLGPAGHAAAHTDGSAHVHGPGEPAGQPAAPTPTPTTHVHGHRPIGEVYVVGVHPRAQGSGLGRAMTLVGLHHLRSRGLDQAMLYVDADNTAAVALYSSLGFRHWDSDVQFSRPA